MSWLLLAVIGHLVNGVAFVIDTILLRTAFSRSATYAGLVGLLSSLVIFAVPFVNRWPQGMAWILALIGGATFVLALWAFFGALARAEASRVVPIVGSLIPILTLAGAFAFLGERLSDRMFIGFGFLILATVILSSRGKGRPAPDAVWLSVTSAFLFAISSVTVKFTYDAAGFLSGFVTSRIAAAAMALILLALVDRRAGKEALTIAFPSKRTSSKHKQPGKLASILTISGQLLGAIGFLFVQWAIAKGSASIVNALQAVQYMLLVLAGFALHRRAPHLLGENVTRKALLLKAAALIIAGVGLYLIV